MAEAVDTDLSVPAGYRVVPLEQRWLFPMTRAERIAMRAMDSGIHRALRQAPLPPEPVAAFLAYQPPISTEARYSRARGRYGRHRGEDGEDAAGLKAKRSWWNRSAALRQPVDIRIQRSWHIPHPTRADQAGGAP